MVPDGRADVSASFTGLGDDDAELVLLHGSCPDDFANAVEWEDHESISLLGQSDFYYSYITVGGNTIDVAVYGPSSVIGNSVGIKTSAGAISACAVIVRTGSLSYATSATASMTDGGSISISKASNGESTVTVDDPALGGGNNEWGIVPSCSQTTRTGQGKGYYLSERLGELSSSATLMTFTDHGLTGSFADKAVAVYSGSSDTVLSCGEFVSDYTTCSIGKFWDGSACTPATPACDYDEFELRPVLAMSDILCSPKRDDCPSEMYSPMMASSSSDRICYPATQCDEATQFISSELQQIQDRVCDDLTECTAGLTYESQAPTAASNRRCSRCMDCSVSLATRCPHSNP